MFLSIGPSAIAPGRRQRGSSAVLPSRFDHDEEGRRIAARWRTVALIHIVQFSDLDERVNGKGRRRR
jgi:hypothetical protein